MSWVFDAPSGVYKNFSLSTDIRRESLADTILMDYLRPEPKFGKGHGESHTITRVLQLNPATRVNELSTLPSGRPSIQTRSIVVSEWGFKIPVTEWEKNLAYFDLTNQYQLMLKDQIALTMDNMAAQAMKTTPWKLALTGGGTPTWTFSTNSATTFGGTSDRAFFVADLRRIYKEFRDRKVPFFKNNRYAIVCSTTAISQLKGDPEYRNWISPTSSKEFRSGQIADIEGFMILESNNGVALDPTAGATTTMGECLAFGADACALVEILTPEIRMGLAEDLGRNRDVGWVGELDAGLVWETGALSRVLHIGSN